MTAYLSFANHFILGMLFLLHSVTSFANTQMTPKTLDALITPFIEQQFPTKPGQETHVEILQMDKHTVLPQCDGEPVLQFSKAGIPVENNTLEVRCQGHIKWAMYVPILVHVYKPVLAAKHLLPAGYRITQDDVFFSKQDVNQLRDGYFQQLDQVAGLTARHSLAAGVALNKKNVRPPIVVKRNQSVKLSVVSGGIKIDMNGVAKSDGAVGEMVRVLNPRSKRIVDAVIVGDRHVEIRLD